MKAAGGVWPPLGAGAQPTRDGEVVRVGDLELDNRTGEVSCGGEPVALSPTELRLLRYLMANPGRVLSKRQLLDRVWGADFDGEATVVESYISYLRRKLDRGHSRHIHTVRGVGYVVRP